MIKVLFFAQIRDQLGVSEIMMPSEENQDVATLLQNLQSRDKNWLSVLSNGKLMVAVNQVMSTANEQLKEGDEVAFFPPVTGG